jgi:hypothetical protein
MPDDIHSQTPDYQGPLLSNEQIEEMILIIDE